MNRAMMPAMIMVTERTKQTMYTFLLQKNGLLVFVKLTWIVPQRLKKVG